MATADHSASSAKTSRTEAFEGRLVPMLVLAAACVLGLLHAVPATRSLLLEQERLILDGFHQTGTKTPERSDVMVLGIDDASLTLETAWPEDITASPALQAMQKQWPWPRRTWAHVL
ncbi:MAG TPA: hypothetical protein PLB55_19025, partial [Prosthecobacter sp.]|nr:hypothetical protein [Prosthecobacter sp.]